ncbi:MAG: hypothetical protein JRG91_06015 [Deltaproteobacteria bacterium]|nr:hypothetical protein [Deltaproteobacteria bacterium]
MRRTLSILPIALLLASCGSRSRTVGDAGADVQAEPAADAAVDVAPDAADAVHDGLDAAADAGDEPVGDAVDNSDDVPEESDVLEHGECTSRSDCGGRACVRVPDEPGGYWLCEVPSRREATDCSSSDPWVDQCCHSYECIGGDNGGCFFSDWGWGFCGGAIMPHNVCVYDECTSATDCTAASPSVCLPRNIQDWPRRRCAYGTCLTSFDCTREPGGFCAPLFDYCCGWRVRGFFCIYPGACQHHSDCPGDLDGCIGDPSSGGTVCDTIACPM